MTKYRILRDPNVADDLFDIAVLIADYAGVEIALRRIGEIEQTVQKLRDVPHIGSVRDEIAPGLRAIPAAGKGVICFIVDDENHEVRILAIGYAGSDWMTMSLART